MILTGETDR